jgi:hypothetical protein
LIPGPFLPSINRMGEELTKEEIEQRARELARRTMGRPPQPHEWPKKAAPKAKADRSDASRPQKPELPVSGS